MNGTRNCAAAGCERPHLARGLCAYHYHRFWKSQAFELAPRPTREERFWAKADRSGGPGACWPWLASSVPEGYGIFWNGTRLVRAHRYALALVGPYDESLQVDHTCHNNSGCTDVPCAHRACVNPARLEAVSHAENVARGRAGEHHRAKTHCRNGHAYTPDNTAWPLRPDGKRNARVCKTCSRAAQRKYNRKRRAA